MTDTHADLIRDRDTARAERDALLEGLGAYRAIAADQPALTWTGELLSGDLRELVKLAHEVASRRMEHPTMQVPPADDGFHEGEFHANGFPAGPVRTITAGTLGPQHIGARALLPGMTVGTAWQVTWAPITRISFRDDGKVTIQRNPDGHAEHAFNPTDLVQVSQPAPPNETADPHARILTFLDSDDGNDSLEAAIADAIDDVLDDPTSDYNLSDRLNIAVCEALDARHVADPHGI